MNRRLHVSLLLIAFFCAFWFELPDAMAPLVLAIPLFAFSIFSHAGVHIVDFASIIGLLGMGAAIAAFLKSESVRLLLWTKAGLAVSALLFVTGSRPIGYAALSMIPLAVLAIWPAKKKRAQAGSRE